MAGPVQLNLAFEEPLHASREEQQALGSVVVARRVVEQLPLPRLRSSERPPQLDPTRPGVVVAGPWRGLRGKNRPISRSFTIG